MVLYKIYVKRLFLLMFLYLDMLFWQDVEFDSFMENFIFEFLTQLLVFSILFFFSAKEGTKVHSLYIYS